jgi:hypothetical protein
MAPSSRFASSLKPNVAYLDLNFCALWKKQTTLPSLAYAGIPYQGFGERAGALALTDDRSGQKGAAIGKDRVPELWVGRTVMVEVRGRKESRYMVLGRLQDATDEGVTIDRQLPERITDRIRSYPWESARRQKSCLRPKILLSHTLVTTSGPELVRTKVSSALAPVTEGFQAKAWPTRICSAVSGLATTTLDA